MAHIKVKANKMGYYGHKRIREGLVFEMDEKFMKKGENGKAILPSWVEPLTSKKQKGAPEIEEPFVSDEEVI